MPHRAHLFSLRIAHALRGSLAEGYDRKQFGRDLLAGLTVGVIAIPLAMALAIASGVAPQYGLYTAIVAGFVIALCGGSRYSVSGPTAAFVVILYPIAHKYGLAGLLMATSMAGAIMIAMAYARLGRLIEYIPQAVTLGFTGGIAIVIATLQVKDLLGLPLGDAPKLYWQKILWLGQGLGDFHAASLAVALSCFAALLLWPRLKTPIPPHLPALIIASLLGLWFSSQGYEVATVGSRFSYLRLDGSLGQGIPPYPPHLQWPWLQPGPNGQPLALNWAMIGDLLPKAFAIAMLGAIESLLCAVVLDGMSGKRHSANSELLGQGLGNLLVPFFGGISATAAIARSAVNFKAGGRSPIAAMVHAPVVLLGLVLLAPWLAYLPMPALAALLIVVAWNMSEAHKSVHLLKRAPTSDIVVFCTCLALTVLFDMVIAITAGILLASLLFMREIADMTKMADITDNKRLVDAPLPEGWKVFKISGPLFFAAADRVFGELSIAIEQLNGAVLSMDGVPLLDAGGLEAMNKLVDRCARSGKQIHFSDWQYQPLKTMARARAKPIPGVSQFFPSLSEAVQHLTQTDTAQ